MTSTIKPPALRFIAYEIVQKWRQDPPQERIVRRAGPWIEAMMSLNSCEDWYGMETGDMIVAHVLDNITHWGGPEARRIRDNLRQHLEEFNANHSSSKRQ